jgi:transposase
LSLAEAARRHGGNWRDRFVDAGKAGMDRSLPGPDGGQSQTERRLRHECEQLKFALAEATVQLRIWQKGSEFVDAVPSPTSTAKARRLPTPCHFQHIAHWGPCGKTRVVPQNLQPKPEPAEMGCR